MFDDASLDTSIFNTAQSEADKSLLVKFYTKSVQNASKSAAEGRPVFIEKEYIEIRFAGNRTDAIARPATSSDKARFPAHYDAFKRRIELPEEGTPLGEWPAISRTQADELSFFNVKTVEQLANVSDTHGSKFMGFHGLRERARQFIELSKQHVEVEAMQGELAKRDATIKDMQAQLAELMATHNTTTKVIGELPTPPLDPALLTDIDDKPKPTKRRRRAPATTVAEA